MEMDTPEMGLQKQDGLFLVAAPVKPSLKHNLTGAPKYNGIYISSY